VTGSSFEVRVGLPVFVNQRVFHSVTGFGPKQLLLRQNEYGNLAMWDEEREQEVLVTSFETGNFGNFEAYGRQCPATGKALSDRKLHDGPAGRWSVLEVQFQPYGCADAGEVLEQYAENVGMVRRVANTFAGPRTFDLVYARVGRHFITAGETGRFSVAALPGFDRASWEVALRVDPFWGSGVKVRFPTGQEYDIRLRDAAGAILWTWSADKAFPFAEHTITNIGGWKAVVNVPHPPAIPEGPQSYVLEAWLTTADGEPRFAAATSLDLVGATSTNAVQPERRR
jgi:hypothetical protein